MREIDRSHSGGPELLVESVPFAGIPGQSPLVLMYLAEPESLHTYYPSAVSSHTQTADRVPEVLNNYAVDRDALCDALARLNAHVGSSKKTLENIDLLRRNDAVAVVTGQQAGLFTGPLYTIYKALSAIKMSECLCTRGITAVPVFWAATEDHDFEEISSVTIAGVDGGLHELRSQTEEIGKHVGNIQLTGSISSTIDDLFRQLPATEFTAEIRGLLSYTYTPAKTYGSAFASLVSRLFGDKGLVVMDPLDPALKRLASPVYVESIQRSNEIIDTLVARNDQLRADGYEPQVLVNRDYFPLFWQSDDGRRLALKKIGGEVAAVAERRKFSLNELAGMAADEPGRFSPGVMLRPVVQDYLLPTVCYFGGGAEIAYFAQNSEVYRVLDRPVTPILHRQSFSIVEAKHARTLEKYGLEFTDLFRGQDELIGEIVRRYVDPGNSRLFPDAEDRINAELNRLDRNLSQIDPTLAESLATRRRKIIYHIGALRDKFYRTRIRKDEIVNRQLSSAFTSLLPRGQLQERTLNVIPLLNKHGRYFIDWVYHSIDLDDRGHRLIRL